MSWVREDEGTWKEPEMDEILTRQSDIEMNRYDTAVIVGVGGIGYWIAKLLALSRRVSKIVLIDPQYIEPLNLNRMDLNEFMIGLPKVEAVKNNIEFNVAKPPEIVTIHDKYERQYIRGADIVFECVDHIEVGERVVKDAKDMGIPVISVHYDGVDHITVSANETHGDWGEGSGYVSTPSFAVPAVIAASLAVWLALRTGIKYIKHTWYYSIPEWFPV